MLKLVLAAFFVALVFKVIAAQARKGNPAARLDKNQKVSAKLGEFLKDRPVVKDLTEPAATTDVTKAASPQYRDKFRLMNKTEHALFLQLRQAVPAMLVFSQVSMSQVFRINGRSRDGFRHLGEVGRKSIDFLICRSEDTSIVAAIELNGPTHDKAGQMEADEKKREALESAGIPLLVIKPDQLPDVSELRLMLAPHIVDRRKYEEERNQRLLRKPQA